MSRTGSDSDRDKRNLKRGFSTGTAATAAARSALRFLLTGKSPQCIAVRLPAGYYLPIPVESIYRDGMDVVAVVVKDGGDDPDVTHKAEVRARVRFVSTPGPSIRALSSGETTVSFPAGGLQKFSGICLVAGEGVGRVTKPGLPVPVGEPAVNPMPREMLSQNLHEEFLRGCPGVAGLEPAGGAEDLFPRGAPSKPYVLLPFHGPEEHLPGCLDGGVLRVEIEVPKGAELARHTLNPRLGIVGGISILGTTGIVKPFSHTAYEETIQAALSVARSNRCTRVVLSTGGKSERFAQGLLPDLPGEAFVQVADFFAFSVQEAWRMGFQGLIHSAFFGKVVKMAQGHAYTHAHRVSLDLTPLADLAASLGYDGSFCGSLAEANTARHALELLRERNAQDVIRGVAVQALDQSARLVEYRLPLRLLVFDYDGTLLVDVERAGGK